MVEMAAAAVEIVEKKVVVPARHVTSAVLWEEADPTNSVCRE